MKNIKELLTILRDESKVGTITYGLCLCVEDLCNAGTISYEERCDLLYYIAVHRPPVLSSFAAFRMNGRAWYWPIGDSYHRIKWLNKHIKLNS